MPIEVQIELIEKFIEQSKSFIGIITSNMIWNCNDGMNVPEYIDNNNQEWVVFTNKVRTYFKISNNYSFSEKIESIFSARCINKQLLGNLIIYFNSMIDELEIKMNCQEDEDKADISIVELINQMGEIQNYFHPIGGNGMPKFNVIYDSEQFLQWKEKVIYELGQLKQDKLLDEIRELFNSFNGFSDERQFKELKAKLEIIRDNIDSYTLVNARKGIKMDTKKIFIVHGHDEQILNKVELFIRRIGLEPVILRETASKGMTIIEKIEQNSNVAFAIILYTGCDEGRLKGTTTLNERARQNVVFEHGYMVAHLKRSNVVALYEKGVEIPGDLSGVIYIGLERSDWKQQVMRELQAAGLEFDWSKA